MRIMLQGNESWLDYAIKIIEENDIDVDFYNYIKNSIICVGDEKAMKEIKDKIGTGYVEEL
jgi:hypothetical protein